SEASVVASSRRVRTPRPGPISTKWSSARGSIAWTRRSMTAGSCRKCWPKRLRGGCTAPPDGSESAACHLGGEPDGCKQAADLRAARAGEIERGAVIDRGAHDRQSERHVDGALEARMFDDRQSLIVIHREHRVVSLEQLRNENGVRREWPVGSDAALACTRNGGRNRAHLLISEMAALARVRI